MNMPTSKRNRYAGKGKNKRPKSNLSTGRDYTYDKKYQKSEKQKKARARRNRDRTKAVKNGLVRRGDRTKDVHHPSGNARGRSRVVSAKYNRGKK